jgi:outer membrane protein OmpA-like peptidoglycan-associated protein
LLICALAGALVLAGCAGVNPPPQPDEPAKAEPQVAPPAPAPSAADQRAAAPAALSAERKWLQSLFAGTPVRIAQTRDGPVAVDVPREFCFEPGQSQIKPPLAAVLDKVSQSMRRAPLARVTLLAAPQDASGAASAALAEARAAQLQKHLQARGVSVQRIGKPTVTAVAAVQLRLEAAGPQ